TCGSHEHPPSDHGDRGEGLHHQGALRARECHLVQGPRLCLLALGSHARGEASCGAVRVSQHHGPPWDEKQGYVAGIGPPAMNPSGSIRWSTSFPVQCSTPRPFRTIPLLSTVTFTGLPVAGMPLNDPVFVPVN